MVAVLNAIDETKADKSYVDEQIENIDIPEEITYFDFDPNDEEQIASAYNNLKTLLDNSKTVFIRYTNNGELGMTEAVYYSSDNGDISARAIEDGGVKLFYFSNATEGITFASSFEEHENSMLKMSNWDESKTGDVERYPSINAMEEYVKSIIPTESDAIEVLTETGIIDPATNSDETVLTDENGKIILL